MLLMVPFVPSAGATTSTSSHSAAAATGGSDGDDDTSDSGDDDCEPNEVDEDDDGSSYSDNDNGGSYRGGGGSDNDSDDEDSDQDADDDNDCETDPCDAYLPRSLTISVASPTPGQSFTVAGSAVPGSTVTITIARQGSAPVVNTTAVVSAAGTFSKSVTIPASAPPGRYKLSVLAPGCPTPATLSFTVRYADNRCSDYKEIYVHRGWNVTWKLLGAFNYSKPVKVNLIPEAGGTPRTVFNAKPPSNKRISFKVQSNWATGWYTISEIGVKAKTNSTSLTANCGRVLVLNDNDTANDAQYRQVLDSLLISSRGPTTPAEPIGSENNASLLRVLLIVAVGAIGLHSLRLVMPSKRRRRSN